MTISDCFDPIRDGAPIEKEFLKFDSDWLEVCSNAADWLNEQIKEKFNDYRVVFVLSEDTSRSYKNLKLESRKAEIYFKNNHRNLRLDQTKISVLSDTNFLVSGFLEQKKITPEQINLARERKNIALLLVNNSKRGIFDKTIKIITDKDDSALSVNDDSCAIKNFMKFAVPIRVHGRFDDENLYIGIYSFNEDTFH